MALWWDEWPYDGMNGLMKGWMALWRDELQLATWALIFAVSTFRGEVAASPSGRSRFPLNRLMVTMLKKRDFFLPQLSIAKYIYIYTYYRHVYIYIYSHISFLRIFCCLPPNPCKNPSSTDFHQKDSNSFSQISPVGQHQLLALQSLSVFQNEKCPKNVGSWKDTTPGKNIVVQGGPVAVIST